MISIFDITMIRKFFLGFMRIHILYHASKGSICGVEMMEELERHGYSTSPGLIYPLLHSLEEVGYLKSEQRPIHGKMRKYYEATPKGLRMLEKSRKQIRELVEEVME
ncbi:MAG: PadR family transcriptional regulator [Candidatus Bathyarchaeia archaeon]